MLSACFKLSHGANLSFKHESVGSISEKGTSSKPVLSGVLIELAVEPHNNLVHIVFTQCV